jgi:hypothetical protein
MLGTGRDGNLSIPDGLLENLRARRPAGQFTMSQNIGQSVSLPQQL